MKTKWTKTWPKKPGKYWFYGRMYTHQSKDEPKLSIVTVRITGNKLPMYITEGNLMYKAEGAEGYWGEFITPELPKL
jgi:hypothetical protein